MKNLNIKLAMLNGFLNRQQSLMESSELVIDMLEVRVKESGKIVWVSPDDYRAHWDAYTRCAHPDTK